MKYYTLMIIAFIIGQFIYTTLTVYNLQKDRDIEYGKALAIFVSKELGGYLVAIGGLCGVLFILSDYIDPGITRADLLNKESLTFKEQLVVYYRTASLAAGVFSQHLIYRFYNKGKKAIDEYTTEK